MHVRIAASISLKHIRLFFKEYIHYHSFLKKKHFTTSFFFLQCLDGFGKYFCELILH